jgi:hypothetical protein
MDGPAFEIASKMFHGNFCYLTRRCVKSLLKRQLFL